MHKYAPVLLLLLSYCVRAQEKIAFLNAASKPVKEKNAVILRQTVRINDSLWQFNMYTIKGPMYVSMQARDEEGSELDGRYITYTLYGTCDTIGYFKQGYRSGIWHVYTTRGRTLQTLYYTDGRLTKVEDSAESNAQAKRYRDSLFQGRTVIETESEFPGAGAGWMEYLKHHMRYPDRAIDQNIQGTAAVWFMVDKAGHIDPREAVMQSSVEYSIDKEAMRLILESPAWRPAVQDGHVVKSWKRQPFVFRLSR